MAADVRIDIAAEFTGKKAFKQAETSTQKLTNGVKKLAGALGVAYGTTAILAYSKRAVKATAADEKAQKQLALALNNVGLGRDAASSEAYIQRLQREFGIVDDLLRPAYQTLAIATSDTLESQRLLNLALDISAATGKDLGSVTAALSKAYLGNNTSLTRLGVGISKADLKTKSFLEVTDQLAKTFKGAATESANSLSGSMAKLEVATANVSEILGKGIIDSLMVLGNDTSVSELATDMETAATNAAKLLVTISKVIKAINTPLEIVSGSLAAFVEKTSPLVNLIVEGDPSGFIKKSPKPFSTGMSVSGQSQGNSSAATTNKLQKETLKYNKESLKLAKARATFDLQKIQIEAALKTKLSEEDKIRLNLLKAIEEENIDNADKYQKALEKSQAKTKELADLLATVKAMEVKDPFSTWSIDPLTASINALTESIGGVGTAITARGTEWSSFTSKVAETTIQPNLKEFSSSFTTALNDITSSFSTAVTGLNTLATSASKTASDAAATATATANAALTSTSSTATEAIGSSTTSATDTTVLAIATSGAATADTIIGTSQAAADALDKLYSDSNTALTNATTVTVTDFMATSSAALSNLREVLATEAANYAAAAAATSAQAAADRADLAGIGNAGSNVTIIVEGSVIAENDLATIVNDAINNSSAAGNAIGYNRTANTMAIE